MEFPITLSELLGKLHRAEQDGASLAEAVLQKPPPLKRFIVEPYGSFGCTRKLSS